MISDRELAWAAGLFEGEGSVRINKRTYRNLGALLVDVPNTDEQIARFFHDRWDGYLRFVDGKGQRRGYWRWRIASTRAAHVLTLLRPFFLTTRMHERVSLALEFQAQKVTGGGCRTPEYADRQEWYYARMALLNRRGLAALEPR